MNLSTEKIYISYDGGEPVELKTASVSVDYGVGKDTTGYSNFNFTKGYSGTIENVTISPEFESYLDKQRKLIKMKKARERLYRDIERWKGK